MNEFEVIRKAVSWQTGVFAVTKEAEAAAWLVLQRPATVSHIHTSNNESGKYLIPVAENGAVDLMAGNKVVYELTGDFQLQAIVCGQRLAHELSVELAKSGIKTITHKVTL